MGGLMSTSLCAILTGYGFPLHAGDLHCRENSKSLFWEANISRILQRRFLR